jgi:hypothetical protein
MNYIGKSASMAGWQNKMWVADPRSSPPLTPGT